MWLKDAVGERGSIIFMASSLGPGQRSARGSAIREVVDSRTAAQTLTRNSAGIPESRRDRLSQMASFVHLRVNSAYSLLEGALTIPRLAALAARTRMPAVGVTDTNNLFGVLEFSDTLAKAGIQPIVGCTLSLSFAARMRAGAASGEHAAARAADGRIALLAKDAERLRQSHAALERRLSRRRRDGRLVACPCRSLAAHADGPDRADRRSGRRRSTSLLADGQPDAGPRAPRSLWRAIFGDRLYVELQRHGLPQERAVEPRLLDLAYASTAAAGRHQRRPISRAADDFEAHDALLCIAEGSYVAVDQRRPPEPASTASRRAAEMAAQFADLPEALENTLEIARRCAFRPKKRAAHPAAVRAGDSDHQRARRDRSGRAPPPIRGRSCARAWPAQGTAPGSTPKAYRERLAYELDVITGMGFPGYFLIVSDFMKWTKAQRHSGRPGAARAPARWWPGRSTSPISIRCASASCSSASSIPSASRCRTSTSISARSGATR